MALQVAHGGSPNTASAENNQTRGSPLSPKHHLRDRQLLGLPLGGGTERTGRSEADGDRRLPQAPCPPSPPPSAPIGGEANRAPSGDLACGSLEATSSLEVVPAPDVDAVPA